MQIGLAAAIRHRLGMSKQFQAEYAVNQLKVMSTGGWTETPYTHVHTRPPLTRDCIIYVYTCMCLYIYLYVYKHTVHSTIILHNIHDIQFLCIYPLIYSCT